MWNPFQVMQFFLAEYHISDIICLIVVQAARTFLSSSSVCLDRKGFDINDNHASFVQHYLNKAISLLSCNILDGEKQSNFSSCQFCMQLFLVSD
jgi:hypothetical protein